MRLHIALVVDVVPPDRVAVAPVLGRAVHPLAAVLPQEVAEGLVGVQLPALFAVPSTSAKSAPSVAKALPVALLGVRPPARLELACSGPPLRALEPHAPRASSSKRGQRVEGGEAGHAAVAARRRAAGPDAGRVEREGSQEAVDAPGHAGLLRPGSALARGQHLSAGGPQRGDSWSFSQTGIGQP